MKLDFDVSEAAIFGLKRVLCSQFLEKSKINKNLVNYLRPFAKALAQTEQIQKSVALDEAQAFEAVEKITWWPQGISYQAWISDIVQKLLLAYPQIKDGYLAKASIFGRHLLPMAEKSPSFCRQIFPWLIHDILKTLTHLSNLTEAFKSFFARFYLEKSSIKICDLKCVSSMLSAVQFLRKQKRPQGQTEWDNNFWMPGLDYLHLAFAAFQVQNYIEVIIFCDIWCQESLSKSVS